MPKNKKDKIENKVTELLEDRIKVLLRLEKKISLTNTLLAFIAMTLMVIACCKLLMIF